MQRTRRTKKYEIDLSLASKALFLASRARGTGLLSDGADDKGETGSPRAIQPSLAQSLAVKREGCLALESAQTREDV